MQGIRQRARSYKAVSPVDTVQQIRGILGNIGLSAFENHWRTIGGRIYSCQLNIEDVSSLRTFGKGQNMRYALASAYAEMMERLQNLMIFSTKSGLRNSDILTCFADTIEYEDLDSVLAANLPETHGDIRTIFNDVMHKSDLPVIGGEFFDVGHGSKVVLPYSSLVGVAGSNGMCAGNEPAEAMVQGICEILEREVLKLIFQEVDVPPNIPESYYRDLHSFEMIRALGARDVSVAVKDCSMGKGYPVVGVLLMNKNTGRYRFRIGCHTLFAYALERAITEAYQGISDDSLKDVGEAFEWGRDPFEGNGNKAQRAADRDFQKATNFLGQLRTGSNRVPANMFADQPTYTFREWETFSQSDTYEHDLRILQEIVAENGSTVYVRDVSILGFPSYFVYIPGLSPVFAKWPWGGKSRPQMHLEYEVSRRTQSPLPDIYRRLDTASRDEILDLIGYLRLETDTPVAPDQENRLWLIGLFHYDVPAEQSILAEYLLALLYYRIEDYPAALEQMDAVLRRDDIRREKHTYYYVFRDALHFLSRSESLDRIQSRLVAYYPENKVGDAITDMKETERIFKNVPVPDPMKDRDCQRVVEVFDIIRRKAETEIIDQSRLAQFFAL